MTKSFITIVFFQVNPLFLTTLSSLFNLEGEFRSFERCEKNFLALFNIKKINELFFSHKSELSNNSQKKPLLSPIEKIEFDNNNKVNFTIEENQKVIFYVNLFLSRVDCITIYAK